MKRVLSIDELQGSGVNYAKSLLGKYLVRRIGNKEVALMINELELYEGLEDRSSHAFRGNKGRASVMYGPGGHWYVYLCYGMYEMLNLVIGENGFPAAVLIRGAGDYHGPGKLTKALDIGRELYGKPATKKSGLWIEDRGVTIPSKEILATPRIGLGNAGEWLHTPHRFVLKTR